MTRKLTALILTLALMIGCVGGVAEEAEKTSVTVGSMSLLTGDFFTELWGNNTSDIDVRALIHGCSTVAWTYNGEYAVDATVVRDAQVTLDADGNKTYTFTLNEGLKYNNGDAISAYDYAFTVLLLSSPLLTEMGVKNDTYAHLMGSDAYRDGTSNVFSGVRVTDEHTLSLSIKAENLPYYYELMLAEVTPYPIDVLMPGCVVKDDGDGAYIDDSEIEGGFTAEMLSGTILDPDTGYLTHPTVSAGPYILSSYDAEAHAAEFDINPYYLGNFEGQKPSIAHITFKNADKDTMLDGVENGEYDIVNKVTDGAIISDGMNRVREDRMAASNYLRSGYGFLGFACEQPVTDSVNVRKAIAMCVDSEAFCKDFLMGYGLPVYGYYGYGQWMVTMMSEQLKELNVYALNVNAAKFLLIDDGWTLNENGGEFDEDTDAVRYKEIDGVLVPLTINMARSENSGAADKIVEMLMETLPTIGVELDVTEMPYSELLSHYYRKSEREYNMFFLATNFSHVFDPYYTYSTDDMYQGVYNTSGLKDPQLEALAQDLRRTESGDTDGYLKKWMAFETYWNEVLPCVPIYSNVYFDFYTTQLQNYSPNTNWSWASSILYATFGAPEMAEEPTEEDNATEDGDIVIMD